MTIFSPDVSDAVHVRLLCLTLTSDSVPHSAHKKFKALAPDIVSENRNARLEMTVMLNYPELRANPFGDRICKVGSDWSIISL